MTPNSLKPSTDEQRRMSREYRDSVVRRRRSKKGSDETSQAQMEVEAIVADIEAAGSGARPKSRGGIGSRGSRKKDRPQSGLQSDLHHGVSRETVAKYLEDMEDDDFEFVEPKGHVEVRGQGQEDWDWSWVDLGEKGLEEHVIPIVMVSEVETEAAEKPIPVRRIPIRVEGDLDPRTVCLSFTQHCHR